MKKGTKGTVVRVWPELQAEKLKVVATIKSDTGEVINAHMPDREMSAILPRSVLVGAGATAPRSLLDTLQTILARMTEGRLVRVWEYRDRWFFSFQPWRGVRFTADGAAVASAQGDTEDRLADVEAGKGV